MSKEKLISGSALIAKMENELKRLKELEWGSDVHYNAYADAIHDLKIFVEDAQAPKRTTNTSDTP